MSNKKIFNLDILKEIIKKIGEVHDIQWGVWNGGRENICCEEIDEEVYAVRVKYLGKTLDNVKPELVNSLQKYKFVIFDEKDEKEKSRNVKRYLISNNKNARKFKRESKKSIKMKTVYKKSIIGGQNCNMDNSNHINISPTIHMNNV